MNIFKSVYFFAITKNVIIKRTLIITSLLSVVLSFQNCGQKLQSSALNVASPEYSDNDMTVDMVSSSGSSRLRGSNSRQAGNSDHSTGSNTTSGQDGSIQNQPISLPSTSRAAGTTTSHSRAAGTTTSRATTYCTTTCSGAEGEVYGTPPSSSEPYYPNYYFSDLTNVAIRQLGGIYVESNQVTLSGLPAEGAILATQEMQAPEPNCQGHFAYNVNNEQLWYGYIAKRRVFNGDRLKLRALSSYYFDTTLSLKYTLGDITAYWQIRTMSDPGTTPTFTASGTSTRDISVGDVFLSNIITVSNLGANVRIPVQAYGTGGADLVINGYLATTDYSTHFVKNGDRIQISYKVTSSESTRISLWAIPVGVRGTLQVTEKVDWLITPKAVAKIPDEKVQLGCNLVVNKTNNEPLMCTINGLKTGDEIDWYVNGVIVDYLKNLTQVTTTNTQLGRHTISIRVKHSNGQTEYPAENFIEVK